MSDIEGKVAREAMSECGQRASFNPFGVERVKRRGRHAPLRRCRFWNAFNLRSGIRARIASVLRAAVPANHRSGRKTARPKRAFGESRSVTYIPDHGLVGTSSEGRGGEGESSVPDKVRAAVFSITASD